MGATGCASSPRFVLRGPSPPEVEAEEPFSRHDVDLVFLPESRECVHRDAHERGLNVAHTYPSCDAPVSVHGALPGEQAARLYCQTPFLAT